MITAISCSNDTTSTKVEVNSHCAITSAVLGNLQRTVYTKSETTGKDTSYVLGVAGNAYHMYIDQLKQEIYNPDSLPMGTRPDKVVFASIAADGEIFYRNTNGRDTIFTGKDTLDFTQPIKFTCYAYDGSQSKSYTVRVNIHQVKSESFTWSELGEYADIFEGVTSQKAFAIDGRIVIVAMKNGTPVCISNTKDAPTTWECVATSGVNDIAPAEIQLFHGVFYALDGGKLMQSADGVTWTDANAPVSITTLLAVGKDEMYAYDGNQILLTTDAETWAPDATIDDITALPVANVASAWSQMAFNSNFSYTIIGGLDTNGNSVIWKKTTDKQGTNTDPWTIYPQSDELKHTYPAFSQGTMMCYDNKLYSLGMTSAGLSNFYISADGGRNWIEQTEESLAFGDADATSYSTTVDADNYIWIIYAPSGKIVKGRLNRLSFAPNQTVFLKGNAQE